LADATCVGLRGRIGTFRTERPYVRSSQTAQPSNQNFVARFVPDSLHTSFPVAVPPIVLCAAIFCRLRNARTFPKSRLLPDREQAEQGFQKAPDPAQEQAQTARCPDKNEQRIGSCG